MWIFDETDQKRRNWNCNRQHDPIKHLREKRKRISPEFGYCPNQQQRYVQ